MIGGAAQSYRPQFSISAVAADETNHPVLGQLTVNQPLFRGGRTWAEVGRAKSQVRAGLAQLTNVEEGVLLDAVTAYMDVVRDAATLKLAARTALPCCRKQLDATQNQFKVGELTRAPMWRNRRRAFPAAQADLTHAQFGQLQISRSNFEHYHRPACRHAGEQHPAVLALPGSSRTATDRRSLSPPIRW